MNALFVLYGGLSTNSAIPLALHARELARRGHDCAVAVPEADARDAGTHGALRVVTYSQALERAASVFADGRPADVIHAWTPREGVRRFVTAYQARRATPWVAYLEDNEAWIAKVALGLAGMREETILQHATEVISTWTPEGIPHLLRYSHFIALADAAVVIQDKLAAEVPPWVPCSTVMPGVDLALFAPGPADADLRARFGVGKDERVIVYPGGLNDFTRPGLEAVCRAVALVNERGIPCRLLRSGPVALDFLDRLPAGAARHITEVGALPRVEMPAFLRLADVFVQPGEPDPFEDLRLPGKLPELFATGKPVILPDANIASLLRDGIDAVLHHTGKPEEIAQKCLDLFGNPDRARAIGQSGRAFAERHFDPAVQAARLEEAWNGARERFDATAAQRLWDGAEEADPALLVARRLRLLASRSGSALAPMLEHHAASLEFALERARGLETGMAVRDAEIQSLKEQIAARDGIIEELNRGIEWLRERVAERDRHIAAVESSLTWRLTGPIRKLLARRRT